MWDCRTVVYAASYRHLAAIVTPVHVAAVVNADASSRPIGVVVATTAV